MRRTGVCCDKTLAESFFATYKLDLIEPRPGRRALVVATRS